MRVGTIRYSRNEIDFFHQGVTHVATVEVIGQTVERTPPRVSEAVGADLPKTCRQYPSASSIIEHQASNIKHLSLSTIIYHRQLSSTINHQAASRTT